MGSIQAGVAAGINIYQRRVQAAQQARQDDINTRFKTAAQGRAARALAIKEAAEQRAIAKDNISQATSMVEGIATLRDMNPAVRKILGDKFLTKLGFDDPKERSGIISGINSTNPEDVEALAQLGEKMTKGVQALGREELDPAVAAYIGSKQAARDIRRDFSSTMEKVNSMQTAAAKRRQAITEARLEQQKFQQNKQFGEFLSGQGKDPITGTDNDQSNARRAQVVFAATGDKKLAIKTLYSVGAFNKKLSEEEAKGLYKDKQSAREGAFAIDGMKNARASLDRGALVGFTGAEGVGNLLKIFGKIVGKSFPAVTNAEVFMAAQVPATLAILKALGIRPTDRDLEFASKAVAADVTLSEPAIRQIISMRERIGRKKIELYNKDVKTLKAGDARLVEMPPKSFEIMDRKEIAGLMSGIHEMSLEDQKRLLRRSEELD